jgi:hypothetical protein
LLVFSQIDGFRLFDSFLCQIIEAEKGGVIVAGLSFLSSPQVVMLVQSRLAYRQRPGYVLTKDTNDDK